MQKMITRGEEHVSVKVKLNAYFSQQKYQLCNTVMQFSLAVVVSASEQ